MSKILKNNTGSPVTITDVGQSVPASGQLTIDSSDYDKYAASSDTVTLVGNSTLTVNDGSSDLNISDGIDLIKGIFPRKIIGGTDGTTIGNVGDSLKVSTPENITVLLGRSQIFDIMNSSNWMRGAIFDDVQINVVDTLATLSFYEDGALLGNAYIDFINSDDWELQLDRYLDGDDGIPLQFDDDTKINMD